MRSRILIVPALALVLAALPAVAQDWAGKGRASGTVVDVDGQPVEGATVTMTPQDDPDVGPPAVTTNKKGRWSMLGLRHGAWVVVVEKEGFKTAEGPYAVNAFNASPSLEVVLAPSPFSSITVGDELMAAGDNAGARAAYETALANLDEMAAARLKSRIGDTYMAEGDYAGARAVYMDALRTLSPDEQTHVRLQVANSYQLEGMVEEARQEYERLLPLLEGADQAQIHMAVARTYGQQGDNANAIAALEKAHQVAPDDVAVLQLIADLLVREGRDAEAQAYLQKMPEGTKLPPDMLLNAGIQKYNEGDMDAALDYFNRTVEENSSLADAYYYRGLVYLARGANAEATADFEKLLALDGDSPQAAEARDFLEFLKQSG